jgi:hypothetical protein
MVTETRAMRLPTDCVRPETISESEFLTSGFASCANTFVVGPAFSVVGVAVERPAIARGKVDVFAVGICPTARPCMAMSSRMIMMMMMMMMMPDVRLLRKAVCRSNTGSTKHKAHGKGYT